MALAKCPECSSDISDQAEACPKCGHPLVRNKKGRSGSAFLSILLGIGACWLWFGPHWYFIFPMASAIFGAVLLLNGVIQYSKA